MANTFKVKTNGAMPSSAGTPLTLYTVPSSTTTVIIGLTLCNIHTTGVTASVQLVSDTSDTETNETVLLVKDVSIPAGSSLELLTGGKVVAQATDIIKIDCSVTAKLDATLSILEIT
ncbi:structural protein [Pelagibacter phage HTVC026P]|nr:structural protein [Pelagibacter phage HTVC026P]